MKEKTKRAKEKRKDKQKKNYVEQEQEHVGQPETTYARRVDIDIYIRLSNNRILNGVIVKRLLRLKEAMYRN